MARLFVVARSGQRLLSGELGDALDRLLLAGQRPSTLTDRPKVTTRPEAALHNRPLSGIQIRS